MLLLILSAYFVTNFAESHVITVYGDVYKDKDFFSRTFPWIIDNIGGSVTVEYYLLGSGLHSVPQMCVLQDLSRNTFLQAQFLKCETEGNPTEFCVCETGIDPQRFKECVQLAGNLANYAAEKFSRLNIDTTPIIEAGPHNTIVEVKDLKKMCIALFGDEQPRGCLKPFQCNRTEEWSYRRGIAQIDRRCRRTAEDVHRNTDSYEATTPTTELYSFVW